MAFKAFPQVQFIKGIGPKRAEKLQQAGVLHADDLLFYFPRRYLDRREVRPINSVEIGQMVTVIGEIFSKSSPPRFGRRMSVLSVKIKDETGALYAVWFNQPFLKNYFQQGDQVILSGRVELYRERIQIVSPEFEILSSQDSAQGGQEFAGILPIYSLPEGFSQRYFRKIMRGALDEYIPKLTETLPFDIRNRHQLLNIAKSIRQIHFPENEEGKAAAYRRLSFEEFFLFQIPLILRKLRRRVKKGHVFTAGQDVLVSFFESLPFDLTLSQKRAFEEIRADMASPRPMQRILQGDVGCGKTVVATGACLIAVSGGFQAAFMAPTEILAVQHYEKIKGQLGFSHKSQATSDKKKIEVGLLTSGLKGKPREKVLRDIREGKIDIVIGTHAILQEDVVFHKLGLIVIDEQHKFGVSQRALLPQKGANPDVLIMTATPIPRTLSLTLFGDLDISTIPQMPKGRLKVETKIYGYREKENVYEFVRQKVAGGDKVFVVYPMIEENPRLQLRGARQMHEEFQRGVFPDLKVGLIHGRQPKTEQSRVMEALRENKLDILVATTVLEVGIDVPQANVILIEHAERFGLAQLHQMRGRVGRGGRQAYCLLLSDAVTEEATVRLNAFVANSDGFRIAEEDLRFRGPGEFFGERQSGLTQLRIANPLTQMHLLKSAREEVVRLLKDDIRLEKRPNSEIKKELHKRFPEFEKFIEVG